MRIIDRGIMFDGASAAPNERSCAFTSATLLRDGALLVAFRLGTGRDAPDGRLRIMRIRDEGQSWETLQPGMTAAVDGVEGNLYSGYFTELEPGRLLGAFVWVDRSNPELSFVNPETAGVLPMKALLAESADGGASWDDISTFGDPGYGGTIFDQAGNVLGGREGYVGANESWPDMDKVEIPLGSSFAGEAIRIRFRIGSDDAAGDCHGTRLNG